MNMEATSEFDVLRNREGSKMADQEAAKELDDILDEVVNLAGTMETEKPILDNRVTDGEETSDDTDFAMQTGGDLELEIELPEESTESQAEMTPKAEGAEKRKEKRHKRRRQLRFGIEDVTTMGFTDDVTTEGMFIRSAVVHPVGTLIAINLTMPNSEEVVLEGTVQWSIRIPPIMLRQGKKGGMGIKISRFVSGVESYQMLCEILSSESKTCAH